ncbi:MAG: hypothetical protein ACLRXC_04655 [[Clostridium] leptum]
MTIYFRPGGLSYRKQKGLSKRCKTVPNIEKMMESIVLYPLIYWVLA